MAPIHPKKGREVQKGAKRDKKEIVLCILVSPISSSREIKLQVSSAKEPCKRDDILQK